MSNKNYIESKLYKPEELPQALQDILTDFLKATELERQAAVQAGAEYFKKAVENATPRDTGKMARSWKISTPKKDKEKRYVSNKRTVTVKRTLKSGKTELRSGVPLSNVLEYAENSPHQGFIRRCYDENESQIFETIKNTIKNGGK